MLYNFMIAWDFRIKGSRGFSNTKWITAPSPIWSVLLFVIGFFLVTQFQVDLALTPRVAAISVFVLYLLSGFWDKHFLWRNLHAQVPWYNQPLCLSAGLIVGLLKVAQAI
jgi:hypothetical protein